MSFILDALKKSEAERARQSGPTLVDMRIVAPRRGVPAWVIVLGLVLLANLVVLAIVLARGGRVTRDVPATEVAAARARAGTAAPGTAGHERVATAHFAGTVHAPFRPRRRRYFRPWSTVARLPTWKHCPPGAG